MGSLNRIREWREARALTLERLAELSGVSVSYLSRMEAGKRNVSLKNLSKISHALNVPERELVPGEGAPAEPTRVPLGGHVGAGGRIDTSTEQREPGVEYEIALTTIIPDATVAYQVIGESMLPEFKPNMVIVCRAHTTDPRPHLGKQVVIGTADGARLLKTLVEGTEPERYNLESWNAATMRNVELAWVAHICAYIPADEWQLLEKNGGSAGFRNQAVPSDRKEVDRRYNGKRR
jgi:repressor LexA